MSRTSRTATRPENRRRVVPIILLGAVSLATYAALALVGDLRERLPLYWIAHALLAVGMLLAWRAVREDRRALRLALGAALLFRLVAAIGDPALSDDVFRYVWDGRVQVHGVHPYAMAPADPALAEMRDASWRQINHPELVTIYPPLAEMAFAVLAAVGCGPAGFKLALGLVDFGVVLALVALLRRLGRPAGLVVLYAWNPLAVMESAGSGHVEPLGVLLVVLAAGWLVRGRGGRAMAALGAAIQTKLLPLVLVPVLWRRVRPRHYAVLGATIGLLWLPYALTGPAVGAGLFAYAERWERNATVFAAVHGATRALDTGTLLKPWVERWQQASKATWVPWDWLYGHVWPDQVARLAVVVLALGWIAWLAIRRRDPVPRGIFLAFAGVLLLSPTLHPWYVLWVLPFAVAERSWPWLLLAALLPLAYAGGAGDVPWAVRAVEYVPPLVLALGIRVACRS